MKILIAVEDSEFGKAAVEKICEMLGDPKNAEIRIVSAYEMPPLPSHQPFVISPDDVRRIERELRDAAEKTVTEAAAEIRQKFPALAKNLTTETAAGSPARFIVEEAEQWAADLVVVGSHGYGFWKRAWLGSVSNSVVLHAPCSVLVVRK